MAASTVVDEGCAMAGCAMAGCAMAASSVLPSILVGEDPIACSSGKASLEAVRAVAVSCLVEASLAGAVGVSDTEAEEAPMSPF